jgi:HCOMODA/2-hydroxy-3-carboxy-muconic semialdehyde decarboxylase
MTGLSTVRQDILEAARVLSGLGLVTAYGHISARTGPSMLITPAADLSTVTEAEIVEIALDAEALPPGAPAEGWAHLALYRARPDAESIARAQPSSAFAVSALTRSMGPLHGQAAWLGESVPVHDSARLLRSADLAVAAAADLPVGEALLLRGNGALTLGATAGVAVARMWLLALACDVWLSTVAAAAPAEEVHPLSTDEIASWREVRDELLPRLWLSLQRRVPSTAALTAVGLIPPR